MRTRLKKPHTCTGCPLEYIGTGFIEPEGTGANGVLALGDAPNHYAAADGLPFRPYSDDGSVLNRAMGMGGLKREAFTLYNIVACQPPGNMLAKQDFEAAAIEHCRVHWMKVVERVKPRAILALGPIALRVVTGLAGDRLNLEYLRGYGLESTIQHGGGAAGGVVVPDRGVDAASNRRAAGYSAGSFIPVVATYHPHHIKRGKWALLPVVTKDIRFAVDVAKHGLLPFDDLRYVTNGTQGELEEMRDFLRANPDVPLSTDVETNYSEVIERSEFETPEILIYTNQVRQQVTQVNLSVQERTALVCDATPGNMQLVAEIHATENVKVGHNILMFDDPVCTDNGIPMNGPIEDTMWRFHHLFPDLPGTSGKLTDDDQSESGCVASLQYVANFAGFEIPWKHLSGADPGFYGGCDADSALRAFWWTEDELQRELTITGGSGRVMLMDGYRSMVAEVLPILVNMCRRGIPVNAAKLAELHGKLVKAVMGIDVRIQQHIPREILQLTPPMGLKKMPKGAYPDMPVEVRKKRANGTVEIIPAKLIEIDVELDAETKKCCVRARKWKNAEKYAASSHAYVTNDVLYAPNPDCPHCGGLGVISLPDRVERRWARELPFNAASSPQMFAYAAWKNYKVPKNSKRKTAMDSETVAKLAKTYGDPVFTLCDDKRGFVKLDSTYCKGWMPNPDTQRVHSQVGPYPATGQLSGRNPNPQNVPNLSKMADKPEKLGYATEFREALWAEPGHVVVEMDWKSFHVQTLGFEAGDPIYIGLAKTDIHSFFAVTGILKVESREKLLASAMPRLSLGQGDAELGARLKWYRRNYKLKDGTDFDTLRNKQAKIAVLAYGLGQQYGSLYRQNEDSFSSEDEARRLVQSMNVQFEKEFRYRETIPLTVKPNGYKLVNRYGFVRYLYGVQKKNPKTGQMDHGDDWEAAIAFNVQASAHGHLRECVKVNEREGYNERFGFDNTVHDSLRFHCHKTLLEELVHCVKPVMEHESRVMLMPWDDGRGLSVEVEVKVGPDWAHMEEIKC